MILRLLNDTSCKYIGFIHLILTIFFSFYGFIFKKSILDYVFILYICGIIISWTFYNGECPITYYVKKYYNAMYICGEDSTHLTDMYLLFGNKPIVDISIVFSGMFYALSEYIVLKRNNYPLFIQIGFPIAHIFYTMLLRCFGTNLHKKPLFMKIQEGFKIVIILLLFGIIITPLNNLNGIRTD